MIRRPLSDESGFSLIEALVAMAILATALLSLAGVFAMGLRHLASSTPNLLAREKAREAVESVHTARDTRLIRWAQINNVAQGGVFVDGAQPLTNPGPDGIVNTADDVGIEMMVQPGPDNILGNDDDRETELTNFTREVEIRPLLDANNVPNPTLRQLRVVITYMVGRETRRYVLTTYISAIS
jgi:prepilin-type N-terminal cleavage/methylation domain-containing protein